MNVKLVLCQLLANWQFDVRFLFCFVWCNEKQNLSSLAALRIERGLKDIETVEEEDITFEVLLSKPDARGKWMRDGKALYPDQRYWFKLNVFNNIVLCFIRTIITIDGTTCRLKLKNVGLKDTSDISFQCGDVKDSCKLIVRECM